jgi:phage terminase large subunit-like protein
MAAKGADRYLLEQIRDRLDFPGTLLAVRRLSGLCPNALRKLVEDKANGPAVIQSLRHEIGGLVEVNPQGGTLARRRRQSPIGVRQLVFAASAVEALGGGIHCGMCGVPNRGTR